MSCKFVLRKKTRVKLQKHWCLEHEYFNQPIDDYYRPHTEYDGKVMFSVCLFTGEGARGYPPLPNLGGAPGVPPQLGGAPRGTPNCVVPLGYPATGGHPRGTPQLGGAPGVPPN